MLKRATLNLWTFILVLTLMCSQTYGFGVAYSDNYLKLNAGESTQYYTSIQNMAEYNETITVTIDDPDGLVTNKNDVEADYKILAVSRKNPIYINIKMPDNPQKSRYIIKVSYKNTPNGEGVSLISARQVTIYVDYNSPKCEDIECPNKCVESTRYFLGYCNKDTGRCVYQTEETSPKCEWTPIIDEPQTQSTPSGTQTDASTDTPTDMLTDTSIETTIENAEQPIEEEKNIENTDEPIIETPEKEKESFRVVTPKKSSFTWNISYVILIFVIGLIALLRNQLLTVGKTGFKGITHIITQATNLPHKIKTKSITPNTEIKTIQQPVGLKETGLWIGVLILSLTLSVYLLL